MQDFERSWKHPLKGMPLMELAFYQGKGTYKELEDLGKRYNSTKTQLYNIASHLYGFISQAKETLISNPDEDSKKVAEKAFKESTKLLDKLTENINFG